MLWRTFPKWGMAIAAGLAWAALAAPASAQPAAAAASTSSPAPALEYSAPSTCPDRGEWQARVAARLKGDVAVRLALLDRVVARVGIGASGAQARVVFREPSGAERVVSGQDCDEVVSAAALIVAVALGAGAVAPAQPNRAVPAPELPARDLERSERGWAFALGAAAEANNWLGPWPVAVLDISVEAFAPTRSWSARLVGSYGVAQKSVDERRAEFSFWGARLDVCPLALQADAGWRWMGCAELWFGMLQGSGDEASALATGFEERAAWMGMSASTRAQTPALGALRLEAELGVSRPFWKHEFRFDQPAQMMFESPALGVMGRAGIQVALDGERGP
jgi:hypothetical protein